MAPHLSALGARGMSPQMIADASGVSFGSVYRATRVPGSMLNRTTAQRLLAVPLPRHRVSPHGSVAMAVAAGRAAQGLAAAGVSFVAQARQLKIAERTVRRLAHHELGHIQRQIGQKLVDTCDPEHPIFGPGSRDSQPSRRLAELHGWVPLSWWAPGTLDDPYAVPEPPEQVVDWLVVEQAVRLIRRGGTLPAPLRTREADEVIRQLDHAGCNLDRIENGLRLSRGRIQRVLTTPEPEPAPTAVFAAGTLLAGPRHLQAVWRAMVEEVHHTPGAHTLVATGAPHGVEPLAVRVAQILGWTVDHHPVGWYDPCPPGCARGHRRYGPDGRTYCPKAGDIGLVHTLDRVAAADRAVFLGFHAEGSNSAAGHHRQADAAQVRYRQVRIEVGRNGRPPRPGADRM